MPKELVELLSAEGFPSSLKFCFQALKPHFAVSGVFEYGRIAMVGVVVAQIPESLSNCFENILELALKLKNTHTIRSSAAHPENQDLHWHSSIALFAIDVGDSA